MRHKIVMAGIVCAVLATGVLMHLYGEATDGERRQQGIAREIIRLHVVANSDSAADQELKGRVKETVVTYLRNEMREADTVEQARQTIRNHLRDIEEIANEKMENEGFDYRAEASLGQCYFPVKEYGDLTFPAGEYEALRVNLGESRGQNWWCVMYPTLCFVDSTYQIVPESSREKLKESLTEEEYNSLLDGGDGVDYSFRILDWLRGIGGA